MPIESRLLKCSYFRYISGPKTFSTAIDYKLATLYSCQNIIPGSYLFLGINANAKEVCDQTIFTCEDNIDQHLLDDLYAGNEEEKIKLAPTFLIQKLRLLRLRIEFTKISINRDCFLDIETRAAFYRKYQMRVMVQAIQRYHRLGSKGGAFSANILESVHNENLFNSSAQNSFEKSETEILTDELNRLFLFDQLSKAKENFEQLSDERLGKLGKGSADICIGSNTGMKSLSYIIDEKQYAVNSNHFQNFVTYLSNLRLEEVQLNLNLVRANKNDP